MPQSRPCPISRLYTLFTPDFNLAEQRDALCGRYRLQPSAVWRRPLTCASPATSRTLPARHLGVRYGSHSINRLVNGHTVFSPRYDTDFLCCSMYFLCCSMNFCVVLCIFCVVLCIFYVVLCIFCCSMYFLCCYMYFCVVLCIFVLFYVFLCCSMYFCAVLRTFVLNYVFLCCSMYFLCCYTNFLCCSMNFLCCSMNFCVVL